MNGTIIDANVMIDVLSNDPTWAAWSSDEILSALTRGPVIINPIVYAEIAAGMESPEELEHHLGDPDIERRPLPWDAAFLAGKAFAAYRRRGGRLRSPMPDFYIGAHAAVERLAVVTRDPRRFTRYFPSVTVLSPG